MELEKKRVVCNKKICEVEFGSQTGTLYVIKATKKSH